MASRREGTSLGSYRLVEQIGMGGMATVYKAYQSSMERFVAIKILPPHYADDPKFVKRFIREARTIAQLEHSNILPVHDFGEDNGTTYLAMRYLDSGTLKDVLTEGRLTLTDMAQLLGQICGALDYAHRQGVIHRDVKPANILIDDEGTAYLTDFGIAKVLEGTSELTETGAAIGTPAYMAPEQSLGKAVDERTDVYALGVILYEMAVGHVPFQADTPMAVALAHIHEPLPLPRTLDPDIPDSIEAVIIKALAKEPEDRYQSAGELTQAFRQTLAELPTLPAKATMKMLLGQARTTRRAQAKPIIAKPSDNNDLPTVHVQERRYPAALLVGGALLVLLVVIGGLVIALSGVLDEDEATTVTGSQLFDTFDDPAFDGAINDALWNREFDPEARCDMVQQDGVLRVSSPGLDQTAHCSLISKPNLFPPLGSELGSVEVQMQIASDHNGPIVDAMLLVITNLDGGPWVAECYISARENRVVDASFFVRDGRSAEPLHNETLPGLEYDRWYTLRQEVDPDTMTFSCLVDGELVSSFTPENAAELQEARFEYHIFSLQDPGAEATLLVDNFRILE